MTGAKQVNRSHWTEAGQPPRASVRVHDAPEADWPQTLALIRLSARNGCLDRSRDKLP